MRCLGSSSSGNSYLLEANNEVLLLELGVKFGKIKEALKFDLSKVSFALVSHAHGDHSKAVKEAIKAGIDVVMSKGTQEHLNIQSHRIQNIAHGQKFKRGNFEVMAFNTKHDCPGGEPLGFLIRHPDAGIICFITDSYYIEHIFPDVNHWMVEANYCDQILNDNLQMGQLHAAQGVRTRFSHMSIDTCKQLLLANDLRQCVNVILIHLSSKNSDPKRFKEDIRKSVRCNVEVASPGLSMELMKYPF